MTSCPSRNNTPTLKARRTTLMPSQQEKTLFHILETLESIDKSLKSIASTLDSIPKQPVQQDKPVSTSAHASSSDTSQPVNVLVDADDIALFIPDFDQTGNYLSPTHAIEQIVKHDIMSLIRYSKVKSITKKYDLPDPISWDPVTALESVNGRFYCSGRKVHTFIVNVGPEATDPVLKYYNVSND